MTKQALINLKGAKRILSDRSRWNRGALASNDEGIGVHPLSDEAACFCAIGAMVKTAYATDPNLDADVLGHPATFVEWLDGVDGVDSLGEVARKSNHAYPTDSPITCIWKTNDGLHGDTRHGDIIAMFDEAIRLEEAKDATS